MFGGISWIKIHTYENDTDNFPSGFSVVLLYTLGVLNHLSESLRLNVSTFKWQAYTLTSLTQDQTTRE